MTKCLIFILGLSALLLLHGCATAPEPTPQPAPEPRAEAAPEPPKAIPRPAVIHRPADTGVEWVTDTSDLKSRHRFQLAQHLVEVSSATHYQGGSIADVEVGTRLRAVGAYRGDVVVADTIYIVERSAEPAPVKTATDADTGTEAPETTASQQAAPVAPSSDTGTTEKGDTKPKVPESTARPKIEEEAKVTTPAAKPSPVSVQKAKTEEKIKAAEPPEATPPPAKESTQPAAAEAPSAEAETAPPPTKTHESKLAKAEPKSSQPTPSAEETAKPAEAAKPSEAAKDTTAPRDFSQVVFDERVLPMSLDHGWTLDRQPDRVDGATRCVLLSPELTIFDGYYPAKMRFRVNPVRAWVKADSNIDTSYPKQGLRVDGGALSPFAEQLLDEQTAYTDAPVLHRIAEGNTLTVALGFWPTWPKTKTQTARIDLAGFANAYAALRACSKQQQAARE